MKTKLKSRVLLVLLAGIVICSTLFLTGCDGLIGIRGIAYEWANAPVGTAIKIYVTDFLAGRDMEPALRTMLEIMPSDISKIPLENVEIAVGESKELESKGDQYYRWKTTSNSAGEFDGFWIVSPRISQIRIKARKAGYMEVLADAAHRDTPNHVVIAFLVKNNGQN